MLHTNAELYAEAFAMKETRDMIGQALGEALGEHDPKRRKT